jgi:hypothetical protein
VRARGGQDEKLGAPTITISAWINRAGFERWGGCGFVLCVREFKGRVYSTSFNRCRTQAAAQIRRGYAQSETTIHGAPRFSPVEHSQDPRGEVTVCNDLDPRIQPIRLNQFKILLVFSRFWYDVKVQCLRYSTTRTTHRPEPAANKGN